MRRAHAGTENGKTDRSTEDYGLLIGFKRKKTPETQNDGQQGGKKRRKSHTRIDRD